MLSAFFFFLIILYWFPVLFQYDLSYVTIYDDFLLQDSLLQILFVSYASFIHLYLFLSTYLCNCKKGPFLYNKILGNYFEDMKYFEDSQDVIKLPLTWTQTKIGFSYQANEKTLQRVLLLLERTSTRMSHTQSNLESEMPGECSGSCLIHNRIAAVYNWENRENLSTSLLPGLCQRGKVKASGSEVVFPH